MLLSEYHQIFVEEVSYYKRPPGTHRTYKKLMEITRSEEKTIMIMTKYMNISPKEISNRKSNIRYNLKRYWQRKLNSIQ